MTITADQSKRALLKKWINIYLLAAAGCLMFGSIYEHFSHGVYSVFMLGACLIPLTLGALPLFIIDKKSAVMPGSLLLQLHACGIATLTVGSIFQGVLEIYGTTNSLSVIYLAAGLLIMAVCAVIYIMGVKAYKKRGQSDL